MSGVLFAKVVGALPSTLDANTFYAVRVGDGFDFYLTDSDGNMAMAMNTARFITFTDEAAFNAYEAPDNVVAILANA